jgi:hypothetical protein
LNVEGNDRHGYRRKVKSTEFHFNKGPRGPFCV